VNPWLTPAQMSLVRLSVLVEANRQTSDLQRIAHFRREAVSAIEDIPKARAA
jgi:hypothetical protein